MVHKAPHGKNCTREVARYDGDIEKLNVEKLIFLERAVHHSNDHFRLQLLRKVEADEACGTIQESLVVILLFLVGVQRFVVISQADRSTS